MTEFVITQQPRKPLQSLSLTLSLKEGQILTPFPLSRACHDRRRNHQLAPLLCSIAGRRGPAGAPLVQTGGLDLRTLVQGEIAQANRARHAGFRGPSRFGSADFGQLDGAGRFAGAGVAGAARVDVPLLSVFGGAERCGERFCLREGLLCDRGWGSWLGDGELSLGVTACAWRRGCLECLIWFEVFGGVHYCARYRSDYSSPLCSNM